MPSCSYTQTMQHRTIAPSHHRTMHHQNHFQMPYSMLHRFGPHRHVKITHIAGTKRPFLLAPWAQDTPPETNAPLCRPPAPRVETQAVISTLQLEIVTQLRSEHRRDKVLHLETRTRLSRFLQAVFLCDYAAAGEVLAKFRTACTWTGSSDKSVHIYISCFATLLTQACRPNKPAPAMRELTAFVAAAQRFPRRVDLGGRCSPHESLHPQLVRCLLVLVLMRRLAATPSRNRIAHVNFVAYIRRLAAQFGLSPEAVLEKTRATSPGLLVQYNVVFQRHEHGPEPTDEEHAGLGHALEALKGDQHAVSFDALCRFVETHAFDASGFGATAHTKYYELFDALPDEQRHAFLDAYLAFNHKKQLVVEDASQNVHRALSGLGQMAGFTMLHQHWIRSWIRAASDNIQQRLDSNAELKKYSFVFEALPIETVVAVCLTHVLSATVLAPYTKVLPLAIKIGHSLHVSLGQADKVAFSPNNRQLVFGNDQAIEFACTMIQILIQKCTLPESAFSKAANESGTGKVAETVTETVTATAENNTEVETDNEVWGNKVFRFRHVRDQHGMSRLWRLGVVQSNPIVAEHFQIYQELFQTGEYRLPMIHPPKPWKTPSDGGFLSISMPLVKSSEPKTSDVYMKQAHETGQLASVYLSVNALGSCAWTINPYTLNAFNELWDLHEICRLIPTLAPHLERTTPKPSKDAFPDVESYRKALARWRAVELSNKKKEQEAQNLKIYYVMVKRLANSFAKNGEILYFPHFLDFRGRVYPAVSFLSHYSEDMVRSLLMFWEAKPLGDEGYAWLMYQIANLYNKRKMTMDELRAFVEEHRKEIKESAAKPLAPNAWWLHADTPWQVLALCHEFDQIWKFEGDVSTYKSRIPVHQDGSCNGLQHYSALGADKEAARAVNVLPDEKMRDVYTTVLGLVEERIAKDSQNKAENDMATDAQKVLSRKLIKQTIMTTVYGVTPYGAAKQVRKQIDDLAQSGPDTQIHETKRLALASYISNHVLESITDLFSGAKLIQNWLVENCARCIQAYDLKDYPVDEEVEFFSGKHFRPMMWTSLSGFPVIQMYRKRHTRELITPLLNLCVNDDTRLAPIDPLKLKNGVAPNFIHSIDAIHLLMTCLGAKAEHITFASVHDSFWTHPSEVNTLSKILREEFARLHSSNIIENLRQDLVHINRNSHQLVWASKKLDEIFITELKNLRDTYVTGSGKLSGLQKLNAHLRAELEDNLRVDALVTRHAPRLLWEMSKSSPPMVYSDAFPHTIIQEHIGTRTHVPLLVPVKILEAPAVGTLDIQTVLRSKYFFS